MKRLYIIIILGLFSCNNNDTPESDPSIAPPPSGIAAPANINYTVLGIYPHDTSAYTQGLEFYNGKLLESTGDFEASSLRITVAKTGKVDKIHVMGSSTIFGEGITVFNDKIYQLTWQNNVVNVYDVKNIETPIKTFAWPYEGWGITHDKEQLIVSDGSANIYFVDPETFKVKSTLVVRDHQGSIKYLNELEYVNGSLYANVYETYNILKIDPQSGIVQGVLNFEGLLQPTDVVPYRTNVLNGIAYDSASTHFFITGKRWPKMFEVKLN